MSADAPPAVRPARRAPWGVVGAGTAVFATLAALAGVRDTPGALDATAHSALYDALGSDRVAWVSGATWFGNNATLVTAVTLVGLAFVLLRRPAWTLRLLLASGLGAIVIVSLKALFSRERPVEQIVAAHGWSFPSGHAFASTVFYGVLISLVWRATQRTDLRAAAALVGVALITAVGLSRVYLNVHYLTDVVAGWAAGVVWLVLSQLIAGAVLRRWPLRGEDAPA